jgi:RNA polymerase sigma factor (TIGR02999 family)
MPEDGEITKLLEKAADGDGVALDKVIALVYDDLERLARKHMARQFGDAAAGVTLEPGHIVSDTWLRLIRQRNRFDNRGHFFAIATRIMLRVLLDYQRRRSAKKKGGHLVHVSLGALRGKVGPSPAIEIHDFARALEALEELDRRKADVVKHHVIWGQTLSEVAAALDRSLATVERDWRFARAWLAARLRGRDAEP